MTPAFSWAARKAASAWGVNGLTILGPENPSASIPSPSPSRLFSCSLSCPGVRLTCTSEEPWAVCIDISFDEVVGEDSNSSVTVNLSSIDLAMITSRQPLLGKGKKGQSISRDQKASPVGGAGR